MAQYHPPLRDMQFVLHELLGVGVGAQVAGVDGEPDRARQRGVPGLHHRGQRIAHRTRTIIEFDRAADVDAARVHLHRDAADPAFEQSPQSRQTSRLAHCGVEHLFLEACVVLADDRDLQFLA